MRYIIIAMIGLLLFVGCSSDDANTTTTAPSMSDTPQPAVDSSDQPPRIPTLEGD